MITSTLIAMSATSLLGLLVLGLMLGCSEGNELCHKNKLCKECVSASDQCNYCTAASFQGPFRCDTQANLLEGGCPEANAYTIKSNVRFEEERELGTVNPQSFIVTQMKPQRVIVSAKPGSYATWMLEYQHISDTADITLLHSSLATHHFKMEINVNCHGSWEKSNRCAAMKKDERATFKIDVVIDAAMCDKGSEVATLGVSGVREPVGMYVFPLCGCDCAKLENQEINSEQCSRKGNLVCGQCKCQEGLSGKTCTCQTPAGKTEADLTAMCTGESGTVCSGRGSCECGQCVCSDHLYKGRHCECDNAACPTPDGILCAGHGQCNCGKCACDPNWVGDDCACSDKVDQCGPPNTDPCNGNGVCECNKCSCDEGYSGDQCEVNPEGSEKAEPEPELPDEDSIESEPEPNEGTAEIAPEVEPNSEPDKSEEGEDDPNKNGANSKSGKQFLVLAVLGCWLVQYCIGAIVVNVALDSTNLLL